MASFSTTNSSVAPSARYDPAATELIFLGTGTSSSLPHIECLTAQPGDRPCRTCLSTLKPEGAKNIRRNTSAAVRAIAKDGRVVTIVVDVGKNFQAAALEWFPRHGLRRIDAVLITHAHADAMNGLDDLRGWTLNGNIQPHIDVYVSESTFVEVQRSFPYLVMKEFASGGGDVPEFKWHIISDKVPFEIQDTGIFVTPFSVHHGRIFAPSPPHGYLPSPVATTPSTPNSTSPSTPQLSPKSLPARPPAPVENASKHSAPVSNIQPYLCFGFKIQDSLVYLSDVSHIPDDVWPLLKSETGPLPVCVLDCLRLKPHTSHMGLAESIATARRIGACRTYLTGFGHEVAHDEYVTITKYIGCENKGAFAVEAMSDIERQGIALAGDGKAVWVRPAHDGLRVVVGGDRSVLDESYR
ncbi:hypothetical protein HGRIS_007489 [Hohenbuehelia grisea]|uniref:Metallo-beta-lactamase domain-containing protein n=1 Tax=Hohenbuehelia grisea TaxID=104357 RepID=A0ABR3J5D7_9AGAR